MHIRAPARRAIGRAGALDVIRAILACAIAIALASCGGLGLFRQYEYEEEMYLSLDGTATVYVNSSMVALNALRGTSFETRTVDRDAVREYFTTPVTRVTRVARSMRSGRWFVHVRLDVDDVTRLGEAAPFGWSTYRFRREGDGYAYEQTVTAAARRQPGPVPGQVIVQTPRPTGWTGREIAAFRLHLPSKVTDNNTERKVVGRGNILVWEQPLSDRLRGTPLTLEVKMDAQSILSRTLWLFAGTFLAVAAAFVAVIWWVLKRAPRERDLQSRVMSHEL